MATTEQRKLPDDERLFSGVLLLNAKVLGFVFGLLFAIFIFIATNWLVLKGGEKVGPNLVLLANYFIGYRVSFVGSLIGALYGFALGTITGAFIGWIYNSIVALRHRLAN